MPKINPIDPSKPAGGSVVKAKTNFNPSIVPKDQNNVSVEETISTKGQPTTNETKVEAKTLDPQHEALAKKESALRVREREFQAKEAALDARVKSAVEEALGQYKGRLKSASLEVLNEEGITYDQIVEQAVNQPDPSTRAINQKLEELDKNQKKFVEDSQNAVKAQRDSAIKQIKYDVTDLVESDNSFETIKATGSIDEVVELITRTFDETGKLLTVDQAAQKVEDELLEEAIKIASIGKVKAKLSPQLTPELVTQSKQSGSQQATTLTNNMTSKKPMSARDRAIARFKGENF